MIKNSEPNNKQTKLVEDIAKNLAKETNFNNKKTRKYFGKNSKEFNDPNSNTLMDSLILNQIGSSSFSTNNKTDSMFSSKL